MYMRSECRKNMKVEDKVTTRKATGFKSQGVNCWEIDHVTSKFQQIFQIKLAKKSKT